MRTLLATLCFLTLSAVQARAEITAKEYKSRKASGDKAMMTLMRTYINGLGEGIGWANIEATGKQTPLYCPPKNLALGTENYIDIIDRTIKIAPKQLQDMPIGTLLMEGLKSTFPCEAK